MRIPLSAILISLLAAGLPWEALSQPIEWQAQDFHPLPSPNLTSLPVKFAGQGQRGTISGRVVLPSGPSVNNRIRITLSGGRIASQTTYTDNKGWFAFTGVGDGTYTLEVLADQTHYEPVAQEVRLI
jgi:hypothetical protein